MKELELRNKIAEIRDYINDQLMNDHAPNQRKLRLAYNVKNDLIKQLKQIQDGNKTN